MELESIILNEIKRNFKWGKILLLVLGFVLSSAYLCYTFVLHPEQAFAVHPGIYKITFWGGLNILALVVFAVTTVMLIIFVGELISLYRYYKKQINSMESENKKKTPSV